MCERDIVERLQTIEHGRERPRDLPVAHWHRNPDGLEAATEILRLRAELATARRSGWIAGRDAALEMAREQVTICDADIDEGDLLSQFYREGASRCCDAIRNMEPPA